VLNKHSVTLNNQLLSKGGLRGFIPFLPPCSQCLCPPILHISRKKSPCVLNANVLLGPLYLVWTSDFVTEPIFYFMKSWPTAFWMVGFSWKIQWTIHLEIFCHVWETLENQLLIWKAFIMIQTVYCLQKHWLLHSSMCVAFSELLTWEKKLVFTDLCLTCTPWIAYCVIFFTRFIALQNFSYCIFSL
jgi:hypothetical protein